MNGICTFPKCHCCNTVILRNNDIALTHKIDKLEIHAVRTLFDNNGSLKLSLSLDNLYYIESDDSYIKV